MKYYGAVGYAETVETDPEKHPGVYEEVITERYYYGDVVRNYRRLEQASSQLNDNINVSNSFSIVADPYAYQNFHAIRYLTWMGTKWRVSSVDASVPPRLTLEVGGVYNE